MKQDVVFKREAAGPLGIWGTIDDVSSPATANPGDIIQVAASGSINYTAPWVPFNQGHINTRLIDNGEILKEIDGPEFDGDWRGNFDFDDSKMGVEIPSDISPRTYTLEVSLQVKSWIGYHEADAMQQPIEIVTYELYTLTIEIEGIGRTSPPQGEHKHQENKRVSVQAIPGEDQKFDRWIGDVENNDAESTSIVMDSDKKLTAVFSEREWFDPFLDALYYAGGAVGVGVGLYSTYQAIVMKNKLMFIPAAAGYGSGGYLIYEGTKRT